MMESLTIDTRNVKDLNVVDRNELLMKIGRPVEGEDGYQVDGEVIPKEIETRELKLGRNVFPSDNGKEVYAGQAGHIIWRPDECFIDIEDVYVVEGNVDFSEGNITDFSGKIVITGDVRPKFSVIADGDIEIHGSVEDAIVESKNGSVFIQGIVVNKAEGYVKAAEDIVVAIATNADLRAKNIRIEKEAMNCTLRATEQIILDGNPGVLVGGMARAKKLIRARTIGSASWIQTKIHVGDVQQLQKLKRTLTQKLNKQELDLKGTAESINMLQLREKTHGLSEPQTRQLKEYESHMKELEEDIATDQEEEQRLLTEISERKDSKLEVLDTLYPKVDLYIFKGYLLPHEKQTHSGFCWRDGLVIPFTI